MAALNADMMLHQVPPAIVSTVNGPARGRGSALPSSAATAIEVVIVTAQRREEDTQSVPLSITAFSGETMRGLKMHDVRDIAAQTPGLLIGGGYKYSQPTIFLRGIGDNNQFNGAVSSIAFYFDDVYVNSAVSLNQLQLDLDRVEILRGPQGTLYGRNSTAGAINVISRQPEFDATYSVEGYVTAGSYGLREVELVTNVPISNEFALRVSGLAIENEGAWVNSIIGKHSQNIRAYSGRAILTWHPDDDFAATLTVHAAQENSGIPIKLYGTLDPATFQVCSVSEIHIGTNCVDFAGFKASTKYLTEDAGRPSRDMPGYYGAALKLVWNLDNVTLTSISGFNGVNHKTYEDSHLPTPWIVGHIVDHENEYTQEFRAGSASESAILRWSAGVFFLHEQIASAITFCGCGFVGILSGGNDVQGQVQDLNLQTTSVALYGQADYEILDNLTMTLGARWNREEKKILLTSNELNFDGVDPTAFEGSAFDQAHFIQQLVYQNDSRSWSGWSWRAALNYKLDEGIFIFASASHGQKAGGYNTGASVTQGEVAVLSPEDVTAYEVGIKSGWLDKRIQFDVSLFDYDYTNQQIFVPTFVGGVLVNTIENAGQSRIDGADAELIAYPIDALSLRASAEYLEARIVKFTADTFAAVDYTGNTLAKAPKWSLAFLAQYTVTLPDAATITLQSDASYKSSFYFDITDDPLTHQSGYWLAGVQIMYTPPNVRWSASIWVQNLLNQKYFVEGQDASGFGWAGGTEGDPRTVGVTVDFKS